MNSRPAHYTDREWHFLVQPGEFGWKQEWTKLREDLGYWRHRIEWICKEHRLTPPTDPHFALGTNPVHFIDDFAIKVFVRRNPIWYPREVESLAVFSDVSEVRSPKLVAWGDAIDGDTEHPYIIMSRIPGRSLNQYRNTIPREQEYGIIHDAALATRALHELDISSLKSFGKPSDWIARLHHRVEHVLPLYRVNLRDELFAGLEKAITSRLDLVTPDFEPCFLHADINAGNIMVDVIDGVPTFAGLIDFGDAEVGPIEYEWISIFSKELANDREKIRVFAEAYGLEYPFTQNLRELLKLYFLLHRFSIILYMQLENEFKDARSMEDLLSQIWD